MSAELFANQFVLLQVILEELKLVIVEFNGYYKLRALRWKDCSDEFISATELWEIIKNFKLNVGDYLKLLGDV